MVISGKFNAKKHYDQLFLPITKKYCPTSPNGRFRDFETEPENFFSQNLTYSYSFLRWNSPGITMSLESLQNYFVIMVKSRKNNEKIGFFNFVLWSWNKVGNWQHYGISGKFHAKKHYDQLFFPQKKKKFRPTSQNGLFSIYTPNLRPLSGIEIFFLKIYLNRIVF